MKRVKLLVLPLFLVLFVSCVSFRDAPERTGKRTALSRPIPVPQKTDWKEQVAITGGLAGAFAGSAIGRYSYDVRRTQAQTNKEYGYAYDRGTAARIESVVVRPRFAKRGDQIDLDLTYVILTHSNEPAVVREIREIWYGESLWGSPEVQVERAGGTYESTLPLHLPDDLRPGTYKVRYIVLTPTSRDVRETNFTLQLSGLASPPP